MLDVPSLVIDAVLLLLRATVKKGDNDAITGGPGGLWWTVLHFLGVQ